MSATTLQTFNVTSSKRMNPTINNFTLRRTLIVSSLIVSLLGVAGNGLVVWFLGFRVKRNPITVYILNLAVADFFLLFCNSIEILCPHVIAHKEVFMISLEDILFRLEFIITFTFSISLLILTTISMERCIAVVYPIWYQSRRPKHLSTINCFLIWVLAVTETMLMVFACTDSRRKINMPDCKVLDWGFLLMSSGIVLPLMILSSLVLIIQVQRKSIKRKPKLLFWAILLNLMVFLVCTFPTRLVMFLIDYHEIAFIRMHRFHMLNTHYLLTLINSAANPFIYFLVGRDKRSKCGGSIMVALHRVFGSDNEVPGQDETPKPL